MKCNAITEAKHLGCYSLLLPEAHERSVTPPLSHPLGLSL
jgi:hypothetical protein